MKILSLIVLLSSFSSAAFIVNPITGRLDAVGSGGGASLPLPGGGTNYAQINPTSQQTGAINVSSGTVSSLNVNNTVVFGNSSTPGSNTYSTQYRDVGVVQADSGWKNTASLGFYWNGPLGVQRMNLASDTGNLTVANGIVSSTLTATGITVSTLTVTSSATLPTTRFTGGISVPDGTGNGLNWNTSGAASIYHPAGTNDLYLNAGAVTGLHLISGTNAEFSDTNPANATYGIGLQGGGAVDRVGQSLRLYAGTGSGTARSGYIAFQVGGSTTTSGSTAATLVEAMRIQPITANISIGTTTNLGSQIQVMASTGNVYMAYFSTDTTGNNAVYITTTTGQIVASNLGTALLPTYSASGNINTGMLLNGTVGSLVSGAGPSLRWNGTSSGFGGAAVYIGDFPGVSPAVALWKTDQNTIQINNGTTGVFRDLDLRSLKVNVGSMTVVASTSNVYMAYFSTATTGGNSVYISTPGQIVGIAGSASLPSLASPSSSNTGIYFPAANQFAVTTSGTERLFIDASNTFRVGAGALVWNYGSGTLNTYAGGATAGLGQPYIEGYGVSKAQTAAVASVATATPGNGNVGSYIVSAFVLVTTSSAENFTVRVAYTDTGSTSRTVTLNFSTLTGVLGTAINFANGAIAYESLPLHIRAKTGTAVTISTSGTFTGCTYDVEGLLQKVGNTN